MNPSPNPYESPQADLWPAGQQGPIKPYGDSAIALFEFPYAEPWYRQALDRWWRHVRPYGLNLFGWVVVLAAVAFLTMNLQNAGNNAWYAIVLPVLMIPLLLIFTKWRTVSSSVAIFRTLKECNNPARVGIYREGMVFTTPITQMNKSWKGFQAARRFPDGFLLLITITQFHWLPIASMQAGSVDDIDAILKANIPDYQAIR